MAKNNPNSLFNYLERNDLGKINIPTEADLYIFSILSYLKIEYFIDNNIKEATVEDLAKVYPDKIANKYDHRKPAIKFIELLGKNERYKDLVIFNFKTVKDGGKEVQFGALSIKLPNNHIFASFRGTDSSLVGWKEDANLSFLTEIPAERIALEYLDSLIDGFPNSYFLVGGHSKGGLLAIYSSTKLERYKQDRILYIMDCDCPGFNKTLLEDPGYEYIVNKIHTFIPEHSLVGLIFRKKQRVTVISSSGISIYQHSEWTWDIVNDSLKHIKVFESGEELTESSLNKVMENLSDDEMKFFVDKTYEILKADKENINLRDLLSVGKIIETIKRVKELPDKDKKDMKNISKTLILTLWRRK